jgi:hypothetical protein
MGCAVEVGVLKGLDWIQTDSPDPGSTLGFLCFYFIDPFGKKVIRRCQECYNFAKGLVPIWNFYPWQGL